MSSTRRRNIRTGEAPRPVGGAAYPAPDFTGIRVHPEMLRGVRGRADIVATARALGFPARTVTPALTRFGRLHVVQLGADRDRGTVDLANTRGEPIRVKLPADFLHRVTPPTKTAVMLAAVEADYPPGSLTAALAESLAGLLHLCARAASHGGSTVTVRAVDEVIAPPLRAFLDPWTSHPEPDAEPDDSRADTTVRDKETR